MPCASPTTLWIAATSLAALVLPLAAVAQPPAPTLRAAYRVPSIVLAQPTEGGTLPQDRPVLVFRFAAADVSDPLDLGSLRVSADGRDVTSGFQVTPNEAWGKLEPPPLSGVPMVGAGLHAVSARICSLRGSCGAVTASVTVSAVAPSLESKPNAAKPSAGPQGLIGALVKVARKIIGP